MKRREELSLNAGGGEEAAPAPRSGSRRRACHVGCSDVQRLRSIIGLSKCVEGEHLFREENASSKGGQLSV